MFHSQRSILAGPIRPLTALAADPQPRTISERLLLLGWLLPRQALTFGSAGFLLVPDVRAWLGRLQSRLRAALIHQRTVRVTYFSLDAATQAALQDLRQQQTADGGRQSAVGSQRLVREPRSVMGYKFERLEVWQLALDYTDIIYALADRLPVREEFNLKRQMIRAVTSIALNIAEGSTGQSNAEQARFLSIAVRSLLETVACLYLIHRRGYLPDPVPLREAYRSSETLFAKLQAFRKQLTPRPAPLKWRHFRGIALECGQGDWQRLPLQCSISRIGTGCGRAEARPYHKMSTLESRPAPHVREDPAAYPDDAGLPF